MKCLKRFSDDELDLHEEFLKEVSVKLDAVVSSPKWICPLQRKFLLRISKFINDEHGLVAPPERIRTFVFEIEDGFYFYGEELPAHLMPVVKELLGVFDYESFRGRIGRKHNRWGGAELMRRIRKNVRVCPYCNADLIYSIAFEKDKAEGHGPAIKSAFDHFYPRSRYPFLSLSIYNLIPSCYRCNSQYKSDGFLNVLKMPHPYIDDIDDMAIFTPRNIAEVWDRAKFGAIEDIEFKEREAKDRERVSCYENVFQLNGVYSELFGREAADALILAKVCNDGYCEILKRDFEEAGFKDVDLRRMLLGIPDRRDGIDMMSLSKLRLDMREFFETTSGEQSFSI